MKAKDLMTREPATLTPQSTIAEAATLMKQEDCGSIPIVEGSRLVGIVTDRDIVIRVVAAGKDPRTTRISDAMTADPVTIRPETSVDEASDIMAKRQVRRLPVCEDGKLVGILVIGQVARKDDEDAGEALKEISEPTSGRASHARG
ncbi:MAG TPA: CBS domain-containing protein [Candidatus Limnocylindria bacterium]|nr:CBS domain-containing protein [Candidatus Limnocylindria bacterium]